MTLVFTSLPVNDIFLCLLVSHMSFVGFGGLFLIQVHGPFCKIPYEF